MKAAHRLTKHYSNIILALSLPSFFLIIITSASGLLIPGTYFKETMNWTAQSMGQDVIDLLLISPILIITSIFAAKKNKIALTIWGGTNLYLIYTFAIYCFNIHFNRLFIIYCVILGLSFYSFLYFVFLTVHKPVKEFIYNKAVVKITAVYFFAISCLFYFLWLSKIIPTLISHTIPRDLVETGLTTNPVHIIDLAIFLPGFFLVAILLLRKKPLGFLFAPVMLVFSILMDITIGGLIIMMKMTNIETNYSIVLAMGFLALFSIFLLILDFKWIRGNNS